MTDMREALEKFRAIFEVAPSLRDSKTAIHMPINTMGDGHQVTWQEVYAVCAALSPPQGGENEIHYLGAILIRLKTLYELAEAPNIREQISDELSWLEERLGVAE